VGNDAHLIGRLNMSAEYHTVTPEKNPPTRTDVWHNNDACPEGKRISPENRRAGRGAGTRPCQEC
jgi:hypothetical protein